jgi:hypothetical protein
MEFLLLLHGLNDTATGNDSAVHSSPFRPTGIRDFSTPSIGKPE